MDINLQIIEELRSFLDSAMKDKSNYVQREQDFSRDRVLNLDRVACFILNLSKKSLAIELDKLPGLFGQSVAVPTKGAFSQARYKLKPELFSDWNAAFVKAAGRHGLFAKHWNGFQLVGIDGTTLQLPETDCIREEFGLKANQHLAYPMGQALCAYDVLNGFCLLASLAPVTQSEPGMALSLVRGLPENSLGIYDRGFPLTKTARERLEGLLPVDKLPDKVEVRLVKVVLDNGQVEVLITSLLNERAYPTSVFKELYFYRWGVEVYYDLFKNILQAEIFTGHKPLAHSMAGSIKSSTPWY